MHRSSSLCLLAEQLLRENHPEGEQSDKSSCGGDGDHWVLLRIRCISSIAPGCYVVFTRMLNLCYFLAGFPVVGPSGTKRPRTDHCAGFSGIGTAIPVFPQDWANTGGNCDLGQIYLFLRNLRGSTTQSTNRPTNAQAAMIAIIRCIPPTSWPQNITSSCHDTFTEC